MRRTGRFIGPRAAMRSTKPLAGQALPGSPSKNQWDVAIRHARPQSRVTGSLRDGQRELPCDRSRNRTIKVSTKDAVGDRNSRIRAAEESSGKRVNELAVGITLSQPSQGRTPCRWPLERGEVGADNSDAVVLKVPKGQEGVCPACGLRAERLEQDSERRFQDSEMKAGCRSRSHQDVASRTSNGLCGARFLFTMAQLSGGASTSRRYEPVGSAAPVMRKAKRRMVRQSLLLSTISMWLDLHLEAASPGRSAGPDA